MLDKSEHEYEIEIQALQQELHCTSRKLRDARDWIIKLREEINQLKEQLEQQRKSE